MCVEPSRRIFFSIDDSTTGFGFFALVFLLAIILLIEIFL
jgi:hypothetical protein